MTRKIIGVVVGYVVMFLIVFICFTVLYLILGTEGAFKPNSFEVSTIWIVLSTIVSIVAAVLGGYVCTIIAKNKKPTMILAAIVFVLGIILAIPSFGDYEESIKKERSSELSNMEAMQSAKPPPLVLILNPILGALGTIAGSKLWKEKNKEDNQT